MLLDNPERWWFIAGVPPCGTRGAAHPLAAMRCPQADLDSSGPKTEKTDQLARVGVSCSMSMCGLLHPGPTGQGCLSIESASVVY